MDKGTLKHTKFFVDMLDDERELADSVGIYGKSLLYLVSRALEDVHKMPIFGMAAAWRPDKHRQNIWNRDKQKSDIEKWTDGWGKKISPKLHTKDRAEVRDGQGHIRLAHGSFDNDVVVVTRTLERILGEELTYPVENLRGF